MDYLDDAAARSDATIAIAFALVALAERLAEDDRSEAERLQDALHEDMGEIADRLARGYTLATDNLAKTISDKLANVDERLDNLERNLNGLIRWKSTTAPEHVEALERLRKLELSVVTDNADLLADRLASIDARLDALLEAAGGQEPGLLTGSGMDRNK